MIDITKKYRTRNGREVRIYATDAGKNYPIHGAYYNDGRWLVCSWRADGLLVAKSETSDHDLIEVKPRIKREFWVNMYADDYVVLAHPSKAEADRAWSSRRRFACVPVVIDCEEGEGL